MIYTFHNKYIYSLVVSVKIVAVSIGLYFLIYQIPLTVFAYVFNPKSFYSGEILNAKYKIVGYEGIAQNITDNSYFKNRDQKFSASGVDPHITVEDALSQVERISKIRKVSRSRVENIINANIEKGYDFFGTVDMVNVLKLNRDLEDLLARKYDIKQ